MSSALNRYADCGVLGGAYHLETPQTAALERFHAAAGSKECIMLDVGGFLTSTSFLTQLAGFITTILSTLFGNLIAGFFGA